MNNPYRNKIYNFEAAYDVATRISQKHAKYSAEPSSRKRAIYWIIGDVYLLAVAMQQEGKIERIHSSCIARMPGIRLQARSPFAVIMLLLQLVDPISFDRYKRYRVNGAIMAAQREKVDVRQLPLWIQSNGGFEGCKNRQTWPH